MRQPTNIAHAAYIGINIGERVGGCVCAVCHTRIYINIRRGYYTKYPKHVDGNNNNIGFVLQAGAAPF